MLREHRRGSGSDVWMYDFGDDVAFLLRHGRPIVRDEVMHNDRPRPDVRRSVGYGLAVYNVKTGELRVRAELVRERRFHCRLFGEHLFDDTGFFPHAEMFNLEPIHNTREDIQAVVDVSGIEQVRLIEIRESLLGENTVTIHAGNILRSPSQEGMDAIHQWMLHHGIKTSTNESLRITPSAPLADHLANRKPSSTAPVTPFEYNGTDAIYVEFVFSGGTTEDGRPWVCPSILERQRSSFRPTSAGKKNSKRSSTGSSSIEPSSRS